MTEWLEACRAAARDVDEVLARLPTTAERARVVGRGEGGDETTAIDAEAERVVLARLDALGTDFALVSEELGLRAARDGSATVVVVDPIDGSINAKRGIPFFALSVAVADGPTMGDVRFGYVFDFGTREEWTATRGGGAQLNGAALPQVAPGDGIELLALEATTSELLLAHGPGLAAAVRRTRVLGSLALSLCHLAAGRLDAVCSLKGCRSVDIAAAQLLVTEARLVVDLPEAPPLALAPLDLARRSRIVAATTREQYESLVSAFDAEA